MLLAFDDETRDKTRERFGRVSRELEYNNSYMTINRFNRFSFTPKISKILFAQPDRRLGSDR